MGHAAMKSNERVLNADKVEELIDSMNESRDNLNDVSEALARPSQNFDEVNIYISLHSILLLLIIIIIIIIIYYLLFIIYYLFIIYFVNSLLIYSIFRMNCCKNLKHYPKLKRVLHQ